MTWLAAFLAALPYADRWITAHYADKAAARRQAAKTTGGEK